MRCDVLVAGGGSAGLAAAVSAARCGARTLLVERHGSLGGMATAALVHSICGLYELAGEGETVWANPGFASAFAERLVAEGGATRPVQMGRVHVLLHRPAVFARVADRFTVDAPNLDVRLHTEIISARPDLSEVEFITRGVRGTARPAVVVDASGDAVVAALAGAEFEQSPPDQLQRPAFIFALHGIDANALDDDGRLKIASQIAHAVAAGALPPGALGVALRATNVGEAYVTIDLAGAADFDPNNPPQLARLEIEGRALAFSLLDFLRAGTAGFSAASISALPARVGIRESRRVRGEYRLETADVESGRNFPDAIARATWPMELRENHRGARLRFPAEDRPADIPLRSLRALGRENLFVAGRCLSCSHEAQASIRVMGTCLATGEAAGIAAALRSAGKDCGATAVVAERERLRRP